MNALLEFLPLLVFFAVYKYVGGIEAVHGARRLLPPRLVPAFLGRSGTSGMQSP